MEFGGMFYGLVLFSLFSCTALTSAQQLAGPWPVQSASGVVCLYYRIRNFAIREFNRERTVAPNALKCAVKCNERPWCNAFEFSVNRRCLLSDADIYTPQTIDAWNTARFHDYWQLKDCSRPQYQGWSAFGQAGTVQYDALPETVDDAGATLHDADDFSDGGEGVGRGSSRFVAPAVDGAPPLLDVADEM